MGLEVKVLWESKSRPMAALAPLSRCCRTALAPLSRCCRTALALLVVVGCDAGLVTRRGFVGGGAAAAAASRPTAASAAVDARAPLLARGGLSVPRVGFGLYKTKPEETAAAVALALEAGARHFDAAAAYGNERALGDALRGGPKCFVATKVAPSRGARDAVKAAADRLGFAPDCVYVHSPLAPKKERLEAYEQLLDARRDGLCGAVGVANFGVRHLGELPEPPALVQLELSPYNQRRAEAAWAQKNGAVVTCAAWSKLSGAYNWGSDAAFKALNACCKAHAATKAQVLVRWAVQRGFAPLPRSTAADAAQRLAIAQNAAAGVEDGDFWRGGPLSRAEMKALDALEDHLASGKLGRTDGWTADDVAGPGWDPTTYVDG